MSRQRPEYGEIERRLRQREEELRLIVEHAPMGMGTLDREGRFVRVNRALCQLLGYAEEELVGKALLEITHSDDAATTGQRVRELWAGEIDSYRMAKRYVRKDGKVVEGIVHSAMIRDADGQPRFQLGQFEDRTDRIAAQREADALRDRLAQVDRLSTVGEMAAGIAHEINQPLTAIATYAQVAQRLFDAGRFDSPDLPESLDQIGRQAVRAGEVIRRLRSFVRDRESRRRACDVNGLVAEAVELIRWDSAERGVQLRLELADGIDPVDADPFQIQQVLINLIRNAIDASVAGEGERRVTLRTLQATESEVRLSVEDTGEALDEKAVQRIFEPFYTTKETGMGLGLAISRSIVNAHGGDLRYEPAPEGGSTFCFTLPAAVES